MFDIIAYGPNGETKKTSVSNNILSKITAKNRYAVILENSIDLAIVLIEIYKRKAVAVPIAPGQSKEQINLILEHADVDGVITRDVGVVVFEQRVSKLKSHENHRFIIYTSGSTGNPKGVLLSKEAVEHNALAVSKLHHFSNRAHATCLPLYHCNALMMSLIGSYLSNSKLIMLTSFDSDVYMRAIAHHGVTTASIVPALIPKLLRTEEKFPETLKYFISAAAPLTRDMASSFYKKFGAKLRQGYGLSEAVNFSFLMPPLNTVDFVKEYLWNYPPVGLPLDGCQFRISEDGEVEVKGPNVMEGYWRNKAATSLTLQSGWLKTGDVGYLRGKFLVLSGRKKEIINRGGSSYHPADLEEQYVKLFKCNSPFVVVPVKHEILDNEIGVCVDRTKGSLNGDIVGSLSGLFHAPIVPSVVSVGRIHRTSTGKPQRIKDGNSLFCDQGDFEGILDAISNLKFDKNTSTKTKVHLEDFINKFLPSSYQKQLNKSSNRPFSKVLSEMLIDCLRFFDIVLHDTPSLESDFRIERDDGTKFNFVAKPKLSDVDALLPSDILAYFVVPDKVGSHANPFSVSSASSELFANLTNLNLEQFTFSVSPIKFKQCIFSYLVLITRYE